MYMRQVSLLHDVLYAFSYISGSCMNCNCSMHYATQLFTFCELSFDMLLVCNLVLFVLNIRNNKYFSVIALPNIYI